MHRSILALLCVVSFLPVMARSESAEERKMFADGLMSRHLFARAATEYEALLKQYPNVEGRDAVLFRWAEALRETKREKEADALYARVIAECPGSEFREMSLYKRGTLAKEAKRNSDAVGFFRQILEGGAKGEMRESVLYYLADSLLQTGAYEESISTFEKELSEFSGGAYAPFARLSMATALVRLSEKKQEGGAFERAEKLLRELSQGAHKEIATDASYRLAEGLFRKGKYAESATAFQELQRRFPDSVQAKESGLLGALSSDRANRPAETLAQVEKALSEPGVARRDEWLYLKGRALFRLGRNAEAAEAFLSVINDFSSSAFTISACYEGALAYSACKQYESALEMYRLIPASHALRPLALRGAAFCAKTVGGKEEETIGYLKELDTAFPNDEFAENTLAELAYLVQKKEQWTEAAVLHRRFADRFPKSERAPTALYAAGICSREANDLKGAVEVWKRLVESYPQAEIRPEALYLLGETEFSQNRIEEALPHFEAYLGCGGAATQHRARALYAKGSILLRLNRLEEALGAIQAVAAEKPAEEVARKANYHKWLLLQKLNRLDEAADALDPLLKDAETASWMDPRDIGWAPEHQISRGKVEEAKRVARFIVEKAKDDGWRQEAWYWVGRAEVARGDSAAAEAAFRAATSLKVETNRAAESFLRVGEFRLAAKDFPAAERAFEKGMTLAETQGEAMGAVRVKSNIGLARAWREMGRKEDAARQLLGLCMFYRDDELIPPLIEETVPLLRELGQTEEAEALLKDLAEMKAEKKE